jgi:WD40 repeat protein
MSTSALRRLLTGFLLLIGLWLIPAHGQQPAEPVVPGAVDPVEGEVLRFQRSVRMVAPLPDGKGFVAGSLDGTAKLCDLRGKVLRDWAVRGGITALAISPDGTNLLAGTNTGSLIAWDIQTGKERFVQQTEQQNVYRLDFAPDGKTFAVANHVGTISIFDAKSAEQLRLIEAHTGRTWVVAYSPDGKSLLSAGDDGAVRLWDPGTGKEITRVALYTSQSCGAAFDATGKRLATSSLPGEVFILNRDPIKAVARIETSEGQPVRFSPDGKYLLTGHQDGTVRVWDAATGRKVSEHPGHTAGVISIAFVRPGWFLTASDDRTVRMWKLRER